MSETSLSMNEVQLVSKAYLPRLDSVFVWPRETSFALVLICAALIAPYFKLGFLYYPLIFLASVSCGWSLDLPWKAQITLFLLLPLIAIQIMLHAGSASPQIVFDEVRYYWGFAFMYPFLVLAFWNRPETVVKVLQLMFVLLSVTLILESIVINVFPSITESLGNYPDFTSNISHRTSYFGFYQRPYGLGGSYAETTSLIAILMTFLYLLKNQLPFRYEFLGCLAVVLGLSGTGGVFLLGYACVKFSHSRFRVAIWPLAVVAVLVPIGVQYLPGFSDSSPLWKISVPYFSYLLGSKAQNLFPLGVSELTFEQMMLGYKNLSRAQAFTWTDFGAGSFFQTFGIAGFLTFLFAVFLNSNQKSLIPVVMLLCSVGHYSALFSQAGQLVFCLFLIFGLASPALVDKNVTRKRQA